MNTIADIAGKVVCGGKDVPLTGKLGCLSLFSTPDSFIAVRKGFKIPATQELTIDYITEQVKKGIFIALLDASVFEDTSSEDSYSTNAAGVKRLNLKGLAEFRFTFEESNCFYRNIDRLTSFKNYDIIIIDDNGDFMMAVNSDGSYSGFEVGHITAEMRKNKVSGGDSESRSILMQFLNRRQLDRDYAIIHADQLTFTTSDIPAINAVAIEPVTTPVAAGAKFKVTVKLACDKTTPVVGLLPADFYITVNGTGAIATSATELPDGSYDLEAAAALVSTDVVTVTLWDGSSIQIADQGGVLYKAYMPLDFIVA